MYLKLVNNIAANVNMPPYVSNGLVFQLDGINIGKEHGVWTDLVGGLKFNIGANIVRGDKYFEFQGGSAAYMEDLCVGNGSLPSNFPSDFNDFTIEFVASFSRSGIHYIFRGCYAPNGTGSPISLAWVDGYLTAGETREPRYNMGNAQTLGTFSWTYDYAYRNKVAVSALGTDYWNPPAVCAQIGGGLVNVSARNFSGRLYALRIYDRKLTIDEILHNQQLDIARFGIQL